MNRYDIILATLLIVMLFCSFLFGTLVTQEQIMCPTHQELQDNYTTLQVEYNTLIWEIESGWYIDTMNSDELVSERTLIR